MPKVIERLSCKPTILVQIEGMTYNCSICYYAVHIHKFYPSTACSSGLWNDDYDLDKFHTLYYETEN